MNTMYNATRKKKLNLFAHFIETQLISNEFSCWRTRDSKSDLNGQGVIGNGIHPPSTIKGQMKGFWAMRFKHFRTHLNVQTMFLKIYQSVLVLYFLSGKTPCWISPEKFVNENLRRYELLC